MDGILGIGFGELLLIVFIILIIGGPKNAIKWAREAGRLLRQARILWARMLADLERDLGEDGKEILNVGREFSENVNTVRQATNPRRLARQAGQLIEEITPPVTTMANNGAEAPLENPPPPSYEAWTPPKIPQKDQ
jgi:Sec-independent protein translocase protein TatA